jgi:hypothetical protein
VDAFFTVDAFSRSWRGVIIRSCLLRKRLIIIVNVFWRPRQGWSLEVAPIRHCHRDFRVCLSLARIGVRLVVKVLWERFPQDGFKGVEAGIYNIL